MRYRCALAAMIILSACSPSPAPSPSPSPSAQVSQPLIAVTGTVGDGKHEIELVGLDGTKVARTVADVRSAATAGGNHAIWSDRSNNLWELTADGRTREIGKLSTATYAGIDSMVSSFEVSFGGTQWAWITEADDWEHLWPANQYDPTVYNDVYIGGSGLTPRLVYHDVSNGFLRLYRWTAQGPIFYWHPYADLGMPFPATYGTLNLVDFPSGTVIPITEGLLDLGADGTIASSRYEQGSGPSIEFARIGAVTTIDLTGFYDCDAQLRPGTVATTALVALATQGPTESGPRWQYRTWLVDIDSGRMLAQPIMNARPVWRAWLPDGRVLLEGTSPSEGLFVYSADGGSMREIMSGHVNVVGVLTGSWRVHEVGEAAI